MSRQPQHANECYEAENKHRKRGSGRFHTAHIAGPVTKRRVRGTQADSKITEIPAEQLIQFRRIEDCDHFTGDVH